MKQEYQKGPDSGRINASLCGWAIGRCLFMISKREREITELMNRCPPQVDILQMHNRRCQLEISSKHRLRLKVNKIVIRPTIVASLVSLIVNLA